MIYFLIQKLRQSALLKILLPSRVLLLGITRIYSDKNDPLNFETHVTHHYDFIGDTVIGNDVWIGQNVTILPGVHIGDGAIIGANAVVTHDIPAYHVAGGNPCKVIHPRFDQALIEYLLTVRWWDWNAEKIFQNLSVLSGPNIHKIKEITYL